MRFISVIFTILLMQPLVFASTIKDFTANYAVYQNGFFLGNSQRRLNRPNNIYNLSSITESAGIAAWFFKVKIVETSKLRLKDNKLFFYSYSYDEKQKNKHDKHSLSLSKSNKLYNSFTKQYYPLSNNLHDGLGFTLAIMHDLKNGIRKLKYTIAEKEHLKSYFIKFISEENISTDDGDVKTLKMEHYDAKTKSRFTFWCAEKYDFLPIRINNIKQNGDEITLNLTRYNNKDVYLYLDEDNETD